MIKEKVKLLLHYILYPLCLFISSYAFASLPQDLINNKLTTAVELRDKSHIELLLSKGAVVNFSHIQSAINTGKSDSDVLSLLLDGLKQPYESKIFNQHLRSSAEKSTAQVERVFKLLLAHEPLIKVDDDLLLLATIKGSLTILEQLQKRGAKLNALTQNDKNGCLLNKAIQGKNPILIDKFLEAGFKPTGICIDSLSLAIKMNNLTLVKKLLDEGALVDAPQNDSPIFWAVDTADLEIIRLLLKNKAVLYQNENKKDVLFVTAVKNGNIDVFNELLLYRHKNAGELDYINLLMVAAKNGRLEILKFLQNNKNVNIKTKVIRPVLFAKEQDEALRLSGSTTALHYAAEFGHVELVNYLLKQGLDVNAKEQYDDILIAADNTALINAVRGGHYEVVQALLKQSANVDDRDRYGFSALYQASSYPSIEVVKLLVKFKAAYTFENNLEQPIHIAARRNNLALIEYLKDIDWSVSDSDQGKRTFSITAKDEEGKTALIIASERGYFSLARRLIELGSAINASDKMGKTALHYASIIGDNRLVDVLLQSGARADSADFDGNTSLHISKLNHDVFRSLLDYQYQINTTNSSGETFLFRVINNNDGFYFAELLKHGANIQLRDNKQRTLLHHLALSDNYYAVNYKVKDSSVFTSESSKEDQLSLLASSNFYYRIEWLLQHKIDINAVDFDGNTALHYLHQKGASSQYHKAIIARLLEVKADVNVSNIFGETALFIAANNYQWEAVKVLLAAGANPNIFNHEGRTPLFLAVQSDNKSIIELLLLKGADVNLADNNGRNPIFSLVDAGVSTDVVELLIKAGIDLKVKDSQGRNIVQALAQSKNKQDTLSRLAKIIEQGLDINTRNNKLETALHQSVLSNAPKTTALLLKNKIKINAQDSNGATALHYAVRGHSFKQVRLLLDHHAKVNIPNYFGKTPLHIAVEQDAISMVEILLESGASIHSQDKDLRSPLITAVANESIEIATLLISKGAYVDVQSKGGWQALHFAVSTGNLALSKMLLEKGADPMAELWRGDSAIQLIESENRLLKQNLLTLIESFSPQKNVLVSYQSPLHKAIQIQDIAKIKQLLSKVFDDDDINTPDAFGRIALEKAVISSYINPELAQQSLQLLLKAGADINRLNRHQETSLLLAVRENIDPSLIVFLLSEGAKPALADYLSNAPLLEAARQAKVEIIESLLKAGADIKQKNYAGQNSVELTLLGLVNKTARRLIDRNEDWTTLSKEIREKKYIEAHQQHSDVAFLLVKLMPALKPKEVEAYLAEAMSKKYNKFSKYLVDKYPLSQIAVFKWLEYSIKNKNLVMAELFFEKLGNKKSDFLNTNEGWGLLKSTVNAGDQFAPFLSRLVKLGAANSLAQESRTSEIINLIVRNDSIGIAQVIFGFAKGNLILPIYDPQQSSLLLDASRLGKISMVQFSLNKGFDIETVTKENETALYLASRYGHSEIVKLLLEKGANPNSHDKYGNTPLDIINRSSAKKSHSLTIARLLLEKGARFDLAKSALQWAIDLTDYELATYYIKQFKLDVNQTFSDNSFVLYKALKRIVDTSKYAEKKQREGLEFLIFILSQGADVNKIHSLEKRYPLDLVFSQPKIVKLLLKHGANAKAIDPEGRGHIQKLMSVSGDTPDLVDSLKLLVAAKAPIESQDKYGNTALHTLLSEYIYSEKGAQKTQRFLQILLEQGHDKNKKESQYLSILNNQNETPVYIALRHADNRYMQAIILNVISHTKDFANKPDTQGNEAPVLQVCYQPELLSALIKQGADVNSVNKEGETCLHKLLEGTNNKQEVALMQLLLENGIYINHPSKTGETALYKLAQSKGYFEDWEAYKNKLYADKADLFLKYKPDFTFANKKDGLTPLHVVNNKDLLVKFLAQNIDVEIKDKKGNSLLHLTNNDEIAQQLLQNSANPDSKNNAGETPLFHAIRSENKQIINLLIKHKAMLDVVNNDGDGLLHLTNDLELVKILIAKGANTALINKQGVTPLHKTLKPEIAELLLTHGADLNARDQEGQTALHYAVKYDLPTFDWLIAKGADVNFRDKYGETALFKTAYVNNKKMMMVLLAKGSDAGFKNTIGDNPLHIALANKSWQVADLLVGILSEQSIQEVNWEKKTTLDFAFDSANYGFANLLELQGVTQPEWSEKLRLQQGNPFWLQRALQQDLPQVASALLIPQREVSEAEIYRRVTLREFGTNRTNLQMAAKLGAVTLFEPLINYGNALDAVNSQSQTALMIAIKNNQIGATQALLDFGANPLVRDLNNNTILHMAVKSGNPKFLQLMLEKRIKNLNINARNNSGKTALQLATEAGNLPLVTLLLKYQANPNVIDNDSMSALLFAAKQADSAILMLLIENKASLTARDKNDRTPLLLLLHEYINHKNKIVDITENKKIIRMVEYLLDHGADIEEQGKDKRTALLLAIQMKDIASVLLKRGANIHAVDFEGNTPLLQSVRESYLKHEPIVSTRTLIKMGANLEHYNQWKESALHIAIRANNFSAISLLIDSGAKLNVLNKGGYSPLHNIVQTTALTSVQKVQLVKQLIAQKVELNKYNPINNTALNIAINYQFDETALELIGAGANVNLANHSGNAAIHFLAKRGEGSQKQQQQNTKLLLALKNHKAKLNLRNESGNSPLQLATESRTYSVAMLLLQETSVLKTINQLNFSGNAALHIAVKNNDKVIVRQLIEAKANFNQKNNNGDTALHIASMRNQAEVIALLLQAGARVNIKNYKRETPLDQARRRGNKIAIELLSELK